MKLTFPTSRGEVIISLNENRIKEAGEKKADWLERLVARYGKTGVDKSVLKEKLSEAYDIITGIKKTQPDKPQAEKT